ncbi:MAG TPA: protein translocase subunit SecF [Deltaproteobacteria bacterium]|nr:protein translocase subunit SecF [Deltaproteobacteria bacterium]
MFEALKRWLDALKFDFVSWRYLAGGISALLVLLSWAVFAVVGPNWGIDFTGGTEIHLAFGEYNEAEEWVVTPTDIAEVRGALRTLGLSDDAVQAINGSESGEFIVRIQDATFGMEGLELEVRNALIEEYEESWLVDMQSSAEVSARFVVTYSGPYTDYKKVQADIRKHLPQASAQIGSEENQIVIQVPGLSERIRERIAEAIGDKPFEVRSTDAVGPKVGGELRRQGFISIAATLGLVLLYVAFRFDIGFAPGAVVALFHDVSLTVGIFVLLQLEFNLPMIGALLTIVGYSLNDTIVIYDRIRENRDRHRRSEVEELINVSISETLTRTVATSLTTMMAILMFLILGGPVIRNFAFAMFLGIIFGTYSTVFVASPMILVMEDVKPWLAKLVAVRDLDDDEGDDDGPAMTESEKRRRARADADKREVG